VPGVGGVVLGAQRAVRHQQGLLPEQIDVGLALEHLEARVEQVDAVVIVSSLVALSTTCTGVVTLPQSCSRPAIFSS
jgi:hypothetical protein